MRHLRILYLFAVTLAYCGDEEELEPLVVTIVDPSDGDELFIGFPIHLRGEATDLGKSGCHCVWSSNLDGIFLGGGTETDVTLTRPGLHVIRLEARVGKRFGSAEIQITARDTTGQIQLRYSKYLDFAPRYMTNVNDADLDGTDDFIVTGEPTKTDPFPFVLLSGAGGKVVFRHEIPLRNTQLGVAFGASYVNVIPWLDLDGDDVTDFVLGLPGYTAASTPQVPSEGRLIFISGRGGQIITETNGCPGDREEWGCMLGSALARFDVDGDGRDELLVGAPTFVPPEVEISDAAGSGAVFYMRGSDSSLVKILDSPPGLLFMGTDLAILHPLIGGTHFLAVAALDDWALWRQASEGHFDFVGLATSTDKLFLFADVDRDGVPDLLGTNCTDSRTIATLRSFTHSSPLSHPQTLPYGCLREHPGASTSLPGYPLIAGSFLRTRFVASLLMIRLETDSHSLIAGVAGTPFDATVALARTPQERTVLMATTSAGNSISVYEVVIP